MDSLNLRRDEAAMWSLRGLYEKRGLRRTPVAKFEDYNLYMDNKSFLESDHIITFMDMDGRLLSLKPDVTLSIVKNIPKKPLAVAEKLYYLDEVYRLSRESREYKVLNQIGVEIIGSHDPFANLEAVDLAVRSLALLGDDYILDISHLGFVSGLFDSAELPQSLRDKLLAAIHSKSIHDLRDLLDSAEIPPKDAEPILSLAGLHGPLGQSLEFMEPLVRNTQMREALDELTILEKALAQNDMSKRIFLDFSVVGDLDYYNGLVFLGYIPDVPRAVLTGGRYDNLMKRMAKQNCAVGFAVNLSELAGPRPVREESAPDFDMLITYDDGSDYTALLALTDKLEGSGQKVRLERHGFAPESAGFSYGGRFRFTPENTVEEETSC